MGPEQHYPMTNMNYQIQQQLPPNFGHTGPYTKYLKAGGPSSNLPPVPKFTNRFDRFSNPNQVQSMKNAVSPSSRFANTHQTQMHPSRQPKTYADFYKYNTGGSTGNLHTNALINAKSGSSVAPGLQGRPLSGRPPVAT